MAKKQSNTFGKLVKIVGILFAIFFVFSWVYSELGGGVEHPSLSDITEDDEDEMPEYEIDEDYVRPGQEEEFLDTFPDDFYTHEHVWTDNKQNAYEGTFKVKKAFLGMCTANRERISDNDTWHMVYNKLATYDEDKLDDIIEMYNDIKEEKDLNQKEFADMVVSSIQNIPYYLVHEYTHRKADELWGGWIEEYHEDGGPCLDQIKFGLQSPVEFMSNFMGDCDTRAVLCFTILDAFGYEVAVLASDEYSHAVLGISGNYRGPCYVKKDGIKYYAWETTATGYMPGVLSADNTNMDYWYVDLDNN